MGADSLRSCRALTKLAREAPVVQGAPACVHLGGAVHPHAAMADVEVSYADVPDLSAVSAGQRERGGGSMTAGAGDERGAVAQVDDLVLGQRPDTPHRAGGQDDVPGGVGVAQTEFSQGAVGRTDDRAAQQHRGRRRVGDAAVAAAAAGGDEVLHEIGGDIAEDDDAAQLHVALAAFEQQTDAQPASSQSELMHQISGA